MEQTQQKEFYKSNYYKRKARLTEEQFKAYNRRAKQKQREKQPEEANAHADLINQITEQIKREVAEQLNEGQEIPQIKYYVQQKLQPRLIKLNNIKSLDILEQSLSLVPLAGSNKKKIKRASIIQYLKKIKTIYFLMHNEPLDIKTLSFLSNPQAIIDFIISKYGTETTSALTYLTAFTSITNRLLEYTEAYEIFNKKMIELSQSYQKEQNKNKLSKREAINYLPWDEIIKFRPTDTPLNNLIYNLYVNLPPRRCDYQNMIIKYGDPDIFNLDETYNYYLPDQHKLIFKRYKTEAIYRTQIINLNDPDASYASYSLVKESLINYIEHTKPEDGAPLIPTKHNKLYTNITPLIKSVFKIGEKNLTPNLLRHSFLSWFLSKARTTEIMNKVAYIMAHSSDMQSKYRKLDQHVIQFD
jgi:hypothetical protein